MQSAHSCLVVGGLCIGSLAICVVLAAIEVAPARLVARVAVLVVVVVVVCTASKHVDAILMPQGCSFNPGATFLIAASLN